MTNLRNRAAGLAAIACCAAAMCAAIGCKSDATELPPAKPPVVTVARPIEREYQPYEDFTGNTAAPESVDVRARVSGYLEKVLFEVGTEVKAGDPLFQIDPRPFQAEVDKAQAQLEVAKVKRDQADIEFARVEELFGQQRAPQIEFDRNKALKAAAAADVLAAEAALERAQLDLDWSHITAPISGRISDKYVDEGNLIQGGAGMATLLTNISSMDPIHVYFDCDELTMLRLAEQNRKTQESQRGAKGTRVVLGLADEEGFPHEGAIDFVENKVDAATGTLRVRAAFDNADRELFPGLFSRVRVYCGEKGHSLMIAERAIGQDQGQRYVFVVDEKNQVEYRRIEVGAQEGELRIVEKGLRPEEWVIVNGLQRVRPGVTVEPQRVEMISFVEAPETRTAESGNAENSEAEAAGAAAETNPAEGK